MIWPESQLAARVHVAAGEFVDLDLAEYHADTVLVVGDDPQRPTRSLVVEVQTKIDRRKRRSWPVYVAGLHARHDCAVDLVVIAPGREVARWAATPIVIGEDCCVLRPRVIGPELVPVITDVEQARRAPELAVLSVAVHGDEPGAEHIAVAALTATRGLDRDRDRRYAAFVRMFLGQVAQVALEKIMSVYDQEIEDTWFYNYVLSRGEARGEARGKAAGKAQMLLKMLALKGFAPTDAEREQILGCRDLELLDAWADRLLTARTLAEMFDGPPGAGGP